jgi:hypothetical protein
MTIKKLTARVLILVMLLSVIATAAACSDAGNPDTQDVKPGEDIAADVTTEEVKTASATIAEKYAATDFEKYNYRILAIPTSGHFYNQISSDTNEVYYEEATGDLMNDAIYNRNMMTEELLNITVSPIWATGDTSGITSTVQAEVLAGSDSFDAIINRMDFLGTSMVNGHLVNMKNISTMDVSNPWWDKNIVDSFTLFDSKLYFITGDINFLDDYAVEVIYFNKQLMDDFQIEYPYQSVVDGTWTIDKFYDMCKTAEHDVDGDGKITVKKDVVGHIELNDHVKHWLYPMGEKAIDIAADGSLEIMIQKERQVNVIDKLYSLMVEGEMTYSGETIDFAEGRALFLGNMLGSLNVFRDMETEFGVVPMPKYDETQERYGEYISNGWTTAYGIPLTNQNLDRTGVIMETLCGYSTDTVRVALYDVLFSAKLVRDEASVEMLDIIFASKSYDWAVDFTWGSGFASAYNGIYNSKANNFVSTTEKLIKSVTKTLEKLVNDISALEY